MRRRRSPKAGGRQRRAGVGEGEVMGVVLDKDAQERDGEEVYKGKRLLKVSRKSDKKPAVGSQNAGLLFAPIGREGIKVLHANGANR